MILTFLRTFELIFSRYRMGAGRDLRRFAAVGLPPHFTFLLPQRRPPSMAPRRQLLRRRHPRPAREVPGARTPILLPPHQTHIVTEPRTTSAAHRQYSPVSDCRGRTRRCIPRPELFLSTPTPAILANSGDPAVSPDLAVTLDPTSRQTPPSCLTQRLARPQSRFVRPPVDRVSPTSASRFA